MPSDPPRPADAPVAHRPPNVVRALLLTLLAQFVLARIGLDVTLWVFVLGAIVLQHWFAARNFPALVAGGLIAGAGVAAIARDLVPGTGLHSFLGWAGWVAGFGIIAGLGGRPARWAYGGVLFSGIMAIGALGLAIGGAVSSRTSGALVPILVVSIGVLLLMRGGGRSRFLLLVIGGLLLVVSSSMSDSYRAVRTGDGRLVETRTELPPLRGRTLVIEAPSAAVTVKVGDEAAVSGDVRVDDGGRRLRPAVAARRALTAVLDGDEVVLDASRSTQVTVTVPAGTDIDINGGRGPVRVGGRGGDVDIEADNGPVVVEGWFDRLDITTDNGPVEAKLAFGSDPRQVDIETDNGPVRVRYAGSPAVDAETDDGGIRVADADEGREYQSDGDEGGLVIRTDNGSVRISPVEAADLRVPLR